MAEKAFFPVVDESNQNGHWKTFTYSAWKTGTKHGNCCRRVVRQLGNIYWTYVRFDTENNVRRLFKI